METGSHVAQIPNTCSPRLAKFGQHLEPLLPGKNRKNIFVFLHISLCLQEKITKERDSTQF